MNDEISKEAVVMVVRAIKFEGTELRHAFERLSHEMQSDIKYERRTKKAEKERLANIAKENAPGAVKIRDLMKSGEEIVSTELHDDEIKKFERELKKNGVRYSVKMDKGTNPPTYYIFFKAKSAEVVKVTLEDYLKKNVQKEDSKESEKSKDPKKSKQAAKKREPVIKPKLEHFKKKVREAGAKKSKTKTKQKVR